MNSCGNYIKLFRSLLEWEWYSDMNTCRLFIHMLLKANWCDRRFQGTTVPRGSFVSSYPKLAEECGLTINEIRTCLSHLKSTGEIDVKTNNKFSVFTVKNYDLFQGDNTQLHSQDTVNSQSINSPLTTIEEYKEDKEDKEINTISKDIVRQTDVSRVVEEWNKLKSLGIKPITKLLPSSNRHKWLLARIEEYGLDQVLLAVQRINNSKFLRGESRKGWVITFEWFVRPNNFPKVLEGQYDDKDIDNAPAQNEDEDGRMWQ